MKEFRSMGRAVLVVVTVVVAGCSFKDKGINTTTVLEFDADGTGEGGSGGRGAFDGSAGGKDGPVFGSDGSIQADALPAHDMANLSPDAPGLGLGSNCGADDACDSGFCADGVCCNKRCGDPCFSCAGGNGAKAGECAADLADTACGAATCASFTLTPAPRCDGKGTCAPRPAAPCPGNFTCASPTACKMKCAADGDCSMGLVCELASGACRPPGKPNGQVCAAGNECVSGNCADKVCCDAACTGLCRSCIASQTGKPDGTCANVTAGVKDARCDRQEPSTCGRDGTCDGAGACRHYANGTRCATGCCRDNTGPGGGGANVCAFECNNGTCDRNRPTVLDRCGGAMCCCPMPQGGGGPACTGALGCQLGTCQ
jgi:hypothetical protein